MESTTALAALRALGQEHRLQAFRRLVQAGRAGIAVGELREALAIPAATLSAHLNVMRAAGLVRDQREGRVIRLFADFAHMNALLAYLTENCCGQAGTAPLAACGPTLDCR
jgi:ArsR family transcriptional regulator